MVWSIMKKGRHRDLKKGGEACVCTQSFNVITQPQTVLSFKLLFRSSFLLPCAGKDWPTNPGWQTHVNLYKYTVRRYDFVQVIMLIISRNLWSLKFPKGKIRMWGYHWKKHLLEDALSNYFHFHTFQIRFQVLNWPHTR